MKKIYDKIVSRQKAARQVMAERYNRKAVGKCFQVGDQVLLYDPAVKMGDSKKFHPYYTGPYRIKEQQGVNFTITPIQNDKLKEQCVHQNRLKRSYSVTQVKAPKTTIQRNDPITTTDDSDSSGEDVAWIQLPPKRETVTNVKPPATSNQLVNVRAPPKPLETIMEGPQTGPIVDLPMTPSPGRPAPVLEPAASEANEEPVDPRDPTYHPNRKIPDLPRRQNPKRNAQRPQRYSDADFEISCITADTDGAATFIDQTKKREWM
jgi:hypothetical protein